MKAESQKLYFSSAFDFLPIFLNSSILDEKNQSWKASRKSKAKSQKPKNFGCKKLKSEKSGHMKKFKAKSVIIDGNAESRKRKFHHTAFQLCSQPFSWIQYFLVPVLEPPGSFRFRFSAFLPDPAAFDGI